MVCIVPSVAWKRCIIALLPAKFFGVLDLANSFHAFPAPIRIIDTENRRTVESAFFKADVLIVLILENLKKGEAFGGIKFHSFLVFRRLTIIARF